jgi:hypothetical protein
MKKNFEGGEMWSVCWGERGLAEELHMDVVTKE